MSTFRISSMKNDRTTPVKFGNKLSSKHIHYHRYKMKVRLATQTLRSSVADAIEYLQKSGDLAFQNASGTIKFIRVVDR